MTHLLLKAIYATFIMDFFHIHGIFRHLLVSLYTSKVPVQRGYYYHYNTECKVLLQILGVLDWTQKSFPPLSVGSTINSDCNDTGINWAENTKSNKALTNLNGFASYLLRTNSTFLKYLPSYHGLPIWSEPPCKQHKSKSCTKIYFWIIISFERIA